MFGFCTINKLKANFGRVPDAGDTEALEHVVVTGLYMYMYMYTCIHV